MKKRTKAKRQLAQNSEKDILPKDIDVIQVSKDGTLWLGDEKMTRATIIQLKKEVELLKQFSIWRMMQETMKGRTMNKALQPNSVWEDVLIAKAMIRLQGNQYDILGLIEKAVIPEN